MTTLGSSPESSRNRRVILLAGQAFSLGLTTAWIAIPCQRHLPRHVRFRCYGVDELSRVALQLAQPDARLHAHAMKWLDLTLVGIGRAAVALLDPELSDKERLTILSRRFPLPLTTPQAVIVDIIEDRDGRWRRPWITACALLAAEGMPELDVEELTADDRDDRTGIIDETMAAILQRRAVQLAEVVVYAGGLESQIAAEPGQLKRSC